jgi:hypothetical protein
LQRATELTKVLDKRLVERDWGLQQLEGTFAKGPTIMKLGPDRL